MELGLIGLGRMGANMARRLAKAGHRVVGWDVDPEVVSGLATEGIVTGVADLEEMCRQLRAPRAVWLMIPTGFVGSTIDRLAPLLDSGDTIVDGGNSYYRDAYDRAATLAGSGIHHVDVGVSGGIWGLERGYSLMIGGPEEAVERLVPVFEALAPGLDAAPRTVGRTGPPAPGEEGWLHCGPAGAGHFVKMVHNGIEYGLMAAYSEGLAILDRADVGLAEHDQDAETAPLRNPEYYRYTLDLPAIAEVWRRGSVIGSWLLDLAANALVDDPELDEFSGRVSDSGEGRWTVKTAIDEGVPAAAIAAAVHQRFSSRDLGDYGDRLLSALRKQFGGHDEKPIPS